MWVSLEMDISENEIQVIVFFYEKGKSKMDYSRKETAHNVITKNINVVKLKKKNSFLWWKRTWKWYSAANHLSRVRVADLDNQSCYPTFYRCKLGQACATASLFSGFLKAPQHIWIFWKMLIKGCIINVEIFIEIWTANKKPLSLGSFIGATSKQV